jgi:cellobiose transport system permease protein
MTASTAPGAAEPTGTTTRGGELWRQIRRGRWGYLFISPFYISFLIFGLFPILFSVYLSFHSWKGLGPMQFVGLKN